MSVLLVSLIVLSWRGKRKSSVNRQWPGTEKRVHQNKNGRLFGSNGIHFCCPLTAIILIHNIHHIMHSLNFPYHQFWIPVSLKGGILHILIFVSIYQTSQIVSLNDIHVYVKKSVFYCTSHSTQTNLKDSAIFSSFHGNIQKLSKKFWYEFFLISTELYLEFNALQKSKRKLG